MELQSFASKSGIEASDVVARHLFTSGAWFCSGSIVWEVWRSDEFYIKWVGWARGTSFLCPLSVLPGMFLKVIDCYWWSVRPIWLMDDGVGCSYGCLRFHDNEADYLLMGVIDYGTRRKRLYYKFVTCSWQNVTFSKIRVHNLKFSWINRQYPPYSLRGVNVYNIFLGRLGDYSSSGIHNLNVEQHYV